MQNKGLPRKPLLGLTGQYQNGKSTFLNCLLGGDYAVEGDGLVTTKYNAKYFWGDLCHAQILFPDGIIKPLPSKNKLFSAKDTLPDLTRDVQLQISAYSPILLGMDILDSPGYGANQQDNATAENAIELADFVIYVVQKNLNDISDTNFLESLANRNKRFTVVLNCMNEVNPLSTQVGNICKEIMAKIKTKHLDRNYVSLSEKSSVWPVNLLWAQCALGYLEPEICKKKWNKVKCYLDKDEIMPLQLLAASNFLPMRKLLNSYVSTFFGYEPSSALSLFPLLTQEWTSSLVAALKENH